MAISSPGADDLTMPVVDSPSIHVPRDQNHLAWDPAIPPVATVGSGAVVAFDCLDASNGQLTADSTTADLATLDFDQSTPGHRPVEVAGCRARRHAPGRHRRARSCRLGLDGSIPGFGLLADEFREAFYKVTAVPGPTGTAEFWPGVRTPLAPFCGEIGVAPRNGPSTRSRPTSTAATWTPAI